MGKNERVEGQDSLHTAGSTTGYLFSATLGSHYFCFKLPIFPYCKMACLMKSHFPAFCHDVYSTLLLVWIPCLRLLPFGINQMIYAFL
jgi:hypothetical protein